MARSVATAPLTPRPVGARAVRPASSSATWSWATTAFARMTCHASPAGRPPWCAITSARTASRSWRRRAASASEMRSGGLELDQYKATVSQAKYRNLLDSGLDVVAAKDVAGGRAVIDLVLSPAQVRALKADGVDLTLRRN